MILLSVYVDPYIARNTLSVQRFPIKEFSRLPYGDLRAKTVITVLEAFQYGDFVPDPYIAVNSILIRLVTEYVPIHKWVPVSIWG